MPHVQDIPAYTFGMAAGREDGRQGGDSVADSAAVLTHENPVQRRLRLSLSA